MFTTFTMFTGLPPLPLGLGAGLADVAVQPEESTTTLEPLLLLSHALPGYALTLLTSRNRGCSLRDS